MTPAQCENFGGIYSREYTGASSCVLGTGTAQNCSPVGECKWVDLHKDRTDERSAERGPHGGTNTSYPSGNEFCEPTDFDCQLGKKRGGGQVMALLSLRALQPQALRPRSLPARVLRQLRHLALALARQSEPVEPLLCAIIAKTSRRHHQPRPPLIHLRPPLH